MPGVVRVRREPPPFRSVAVRRVERLGPRMARVTLSGPSLGGLVIDEPASSIRLLLPSPSADLVVPTWNGNEFLLPDGRRPVLRTFTPRRFDPSSLELDLDVVLHGSGAASTWAASASPGDVAAVSGPGRGYTVDPDAPAYLLAGDETALAAITQVVDALPEDMPRQVLVEVAGDDLVAAVRAADVPDGVRVWAAGEAAAMQRIRRHLFEERGVPRAHATVRGYWKTGRTGGADDA